MRISKNMVAIGWLGLC